MTIATTLPRSAPEAQGISSRAIAAFLDAAQREITHLHSLILLRRGAVVAEGYWAPYGPAIPHMLFSLSKSFTSTAIGLLVADGKLSVGDRVLDFFPDDAPADPGEHLRNLRVRHLLTMTTGHGEDPTRALRQANTSWVRAFLAAPLEHEPGTYFVYNSGATYMCSAIAQKITGQRLVQYLGPRLFEPLGIENPTWDTSPEGIDAGGWGLNVTTTDIAKFGQLYLQKGLWQGDRLIPESWVEAATSRQVPNDGEGNRTTNPDWLQGYGYQFWRCRHGAYRGDGAFGQFCVVMPEQEAVLAITSGVPSMQAVLDLVWQHLLPAMGSGTLPDDTASADALATRLSNLRLPPAAGAATSPRAAALSGKRFTLDTNEAGFESITFDFAPNGGATLTIRNDRGDQRVQCGSGDWTLGEAALAVPRRGADGSGDPLPIAASGAWLDEQSYLARLRWYHTPFELALTCRFDGDLVTIDQKPNVGFPADLERPPLEGRAASA
jgi:CubicO group peptidase (beta-lactamase class C family)